MMGQLLNEYIEAHKNSWSDSTLKSERYRLTPYFDLVVSSDVDGMLKATKHLKPYSRSTLWTRVEHAFDWLVDEGKIEIQPNSFKTFKKNNRRLFKNVYSKRTPQTSYDKALEAISTITNEEVRTKAKQLLCGGLRYTESLGISEESTVAGKGGKVRRVYVDRISYCASYSHFLRTLGRFTGLKPHDLRKIRATHLARKGLREAELCKIFGWASYQTASSYIAPIEEDKLERIMQDE